MATIAAFFSLPSPSSPSLFFSSPKPHFPLPRQPLLLFPSRRSQTFPSLQSAAQPPPQTVQAFWDWLLSEGVISSKTPVQPASVPEGLGLVAKRDLGRNEVVLEVPKRFWINPDAVAESEIGSVCSGLKPWVGVALFLIREKLSSNSKWRIYLDILPESTDSTIFWWV